MFGGGVVTRANWWFWLRSDWLVAASSDGIQVRVNTNSLTMLLRNYVSRSSSGK